MTDVQSLSLEDRQFLDDAAKFFRNPGLVAKGLKWASRPVETMQKNLPERAKTLIASVSEKAIQKAMLAAVRTIPQKARVETGSRERLSLLSSRIHRGVTTVTGAAGGLIGLPALAVELPITTVLILRAILDQARLYGHDISDLETRLEALMVLTMGVSDEPSESSVLRNANEGPVIDRKSVSSYFMTRASFVGVMRRVMATAGGLTAKEFLSTVERGSVPLVAKLVTSVAEKFQVRVSQKVFAEGIPLVGAIGGGALNYAFTDFFVTAARFHFGIRALEKLHGEEIVREYFESASVASASDSSATE